MSRPIERWVVTRAEPLAAVLDRLGPLATDACAEGRVFVDGQRALERDRALLAGAVVELFAPRPRVAGVTVLAERDGLLFVEKPAGVATEPDRSGINGCVLSELSVLLSVDAASLHALSRLDVGVSGVVLVARDEPARRRVQAFREAGAVRRRYVAVGRGVPEADTGVWRESIGKPASGPRRAPVADPSGSSAETRYRVVERAAPAGRGETFSVLALEPVTGRTHQLRVHAAAHGVPFLGDRTYGGPTRLTLASGEVRALNRVFLHAAWVELPDGPRVTSRLPSDLRSLWAALGGDPEAFDRAVGAELSAPV